MAGVFIYPLPCGSPPLETPKKPVIVHSIKVTSETIKQPPPKPKKQPPNVQYIPFIVTAYTNRKSEGTNGITASGNPTKANHTLSCPPQFKLGSKLYIREFNSIYTCDDRGGAIKGNRLDLYMNNLQKALEFGKQTLHIKLIGGTK